MQALQDLADGKFPDGTRTIPAQPAPAGESAAAARPKPVNVGVAPVVAQIQIIGLKTVLERQVRDLIQAKQWAPYTRTQESEDLSALLGSGLFTSAAIRRIELSSTTLRIDIRLDERTRQPQQSASPVPGAPPPVTGSLPTPAAADDAEKQALETLGAAEPEIPEPPWVLGEVVLQGLRHAKVKVVRRQINAREGDLYDRGDLDNDYENIMQLGKFDRVVTDITALPNREVPAHFASASPSRHQIRLTFIVTERPLIQKISFEGRDKLSKGRIRDELTLREKDPFDRAKLRDDAEKILELYRKKGFHRARVDTRDELSTETWKTDITYLIEEGPKAKIKKVRIHGVESFKEKKVVKQMENRPKWFSADIFSQEKFKTDLEKIQTFYKNRGHLDYTLDSSSITFNEAQTEIHIDISLTEGKLYSFGDTTFNGHSIYASTELAKAVDYKRKKIFNQEKFDFTIQSLRELYAEKGRLRTEIDPTRTFNAETGLMDVHFEIVEGNTAYVDHTDVEGNRATKTFVFKRELVIRPGMPFSVSKIRKSQERIRNLGFIDDVSLDVQSPFDPDLVDLTFGVVEGKPGMLTAGAGFSSLDGLIGTLSLQHLNMWGRAHRANASWSFGRRVNDFTLGYTLPWILDKPVSLGFDAFSTRRISPFEGSNSAFTSKRTGGSVRVGPRFQDDKYRLNMSYTFQKISLTGVQSQFQNALSEGTSVQSSVGVEFARDTRDNIWDPARGTRHSIGSSIAGGIFQGDIHFFKPYVSSAYHKTLFEVGDYPLVFTASNRASYITPFNETREVPVFERFFIGGQDTLRGYSSTGEVGARNGGKIYDVFNIELGFPLARERRKTIVKFVTFFDLGGSWENMRSARFTIGKGERDLKTDIGFGIRFVTPAFPIRLDWGYGFQHRPGEEKSQINFGIGSLF
ncbi:MAG: outer membrane protein assembly factor BamA [Elusimicrobiota bacterium]